MPEIEQAASAQPDATAVEVSAVDQAVTSHDQAAFRDARRAERSGTPLAPAPVADPVDEDASQEAVAPAPAVPGRTLSKRQQQINDYERRIAEQSAEIARLKTPTPPAPRSEAKPEDPKPSKLTYPAELASYEAYIVAHPEESYEDFVDARTDHRVSEQRTQAQAHERQQQDVQSRASRRKAFDERIAAAKFDLTALHPDVAALRPMDALEPGEEPTAINAIAQEIIGSEHPERFLKHFTDHPEELQALAGLQSPSALWKALGKLEADLTPKDAGPLPQITKAPKVATTLGTKASDTSDPIDSAVSNGDVAAFRAAKRRALQASQR